MNKKARINSIKLLTDYDLLKGELESIGEKLLPVLFEISPLIKTIEVRGWTPSFNDGEPCVHCQDENICINKTFFSDGYNFEGDTDKKDSPIGKNELDLLLSIINSDAIVNLFSERYGTNFHLTLSLGKDGQVEVQHDRHYDDY